VTCVRVDSRKCYLRVSVCAHEPHRATHYNIVCRMNSCDENAGVSGASPPSDESDEEWVKCALGICQLSSNFCDHPPFPARSLKRQCYSCRNEDAPATGAELVVHLRARVEGRKSQQHSSRMTSCEKALDISKKWKEVAENRVQGNNGEEDFLLVRLAEVLGILFPREEDQPVMKVLDGKLCVKCVA
jgi:hypothetical protein